MRLHAQAGARSGLRSGHGCVQQAVNFGAPGAGAAVVLEALLRVRDGDLLLGSSGSDEHVLVAHLRQGRVAGVQDLSLQFGAHGGSMLLRCVSFSKYTIGGIEAV